MSHFKSEEQHKKNLKELGRMGALIVAYFAAVYLAVWANIVMWPVKLPWFLVVVIVGGYFIVPRARAVMRAFEENAKN